MNRERKRREGGERESGEIEEGETHKHNARNNFHLLTT